MPDIAPQQKLETAVRKASIEAKNLSITDSLFFYADHLMNIDFRPGEADVTVFKYERQALALRLEGDCRRRFLRLDGAFDIIKRHSVLNDLSVSASDGRVGKEQVEYHAIFAALAGEGDNASVGQRDLDARFIAEQPFRKVSEYLLEYQMTFVCVCVEDIPADICDISLDGDGGELLVGIVGGVLLMVLLHI